jgi:hypothetical protein
VFTDSGEPNRVPAYQFRSRTLGTHFYTINDTERDTLIRDYSYIWLYEDVAWYAYPP